MEAEVDQLLGERRGNRRLAVDPLQGKLANTPGAHCLGQGRERREQRLAPAAGDCGRAGRIRPGLDEGDQPTAAALDVQHGLILHHHHIGPSDACWTAAMLLILPARPRERGTVRLCRVGGGEHQGARASTIAIIRTAGSIGGRTADRRSASGSASAQTLDGARQRKLRAAHPLDEVAPAAHAQGLQFRERVVQQSKATFDPLGENLLAGDDPVALQQQLRQRASTLR